MSEFQYPDEFIFHAISSEIVDELPEVADDYVRTETEKILDRFEVMSICMRRNRLRKTIGLEHDHQLLAQADNSDTFRFIEHHMAKLRKQRRIFYASGDSYSIHRPLDHTLIRNREVLDDRQYTNRVQYVRNIRRLIETRSSYLPGFYTLEERYDITDLNKLVNRNERLQNKIEEFESNPITLASFSGVMSEDKRTKLYEVSLKKRQFIIECVGNKMISDIPLMDEHNTRLLETRANMTKAITLVQRYAMFSPDSESFLRFLLQNTDLSFNTSTDVMKIIKEYYEVWKH